MLFETHNPFDPFAIKVCKVGNENAVYQLPQETLRVTKFFLDRWAIVSAQLTREHYRRSPVVHGGMEIACKVTAKIAGKCASILLMEKYKQLVQQLYIEPKNEEILGSFLQANEMIDGVETLLVLKKAKVKRKQTDKTVNRQKDIFLRNKES